MNARPRICGQRSIQGIEDLRKLLTQHVHRQVGDEDLAIRILNCVSLASIDVYSVLTCADRPDQFRRTH
jgi:hypothetical protein